MYDALCRAYRKSVYVVRWHLFWRGNYRPDRMFRRGRPTDAYLQPSEFLFFRCVHDNVDKNGQVSPAGIRFPNQSVNRSKYSAPADVLVPDQTERSAEWLYCGVAQFLVNHLPGPMHTDERSYKFTAEHDPLEDNYGHTELRVYKDDVRVSKVSSTTIKKRYRTELALRTRVVIPP